MAHLNYMQVIESTDEEMLAIYMKCKKKDLAQMLLECNKHIVRLTKQVTVKPSPLFDAGMRNISQK